MANTYTIIVKKNDVTIELSSYNKTLVLVEFRKWLIALNKDDKDKVIEVTQELKEKAIDKKKKIKAALLNNKEKLVKQGKVKTKEEKIKDKKEKIAKIKNVVLKDKVTKQEKPELDFNKVLQKKMKDKPETEIVEKKSSELKNVYVQMKKIIDEKHLTTQEGFILAAAYCLTQYEGISRFDLTQLNIKAMPFLFAEIDKKELEAVIEKGYLKLLPDFTGTSENEEYELTERGEHYFLNEI